MGLNCPVCHLPKLFREKRSGFLEKMLYPKIGLFPWKCSRCGKKVLRFDQGYWRHNLTPRTRVPEQERTPAIAMQERPRMTLVQKPEMPEATGPDEMVPDDGVVVLPPPAERAPAQARSIPQGRKAFWR